MMREHATEARERPGVTALGGGGFCAACGKNHSFGASLAVQHSLLLMEELARKRRIDVRASDSEADPRFATDFLFGEARGQMFGVMVCQDQDGQRQVLRAFSCQYNGEWEVAGWAPPLFEVAAFKELTRDVELRVKKKGVLIDALDTDQPQRARLMAERKALSRKLMQEIHGLYRLHNFRGEVRSLAEVFAGPGGIPTGAGDCCAPKLLNQAAQSKLTPLGIAEFYWGRENRSRTREHGSFYPACREKCAPILGFLLCGLDG